MTYDPRQTFKAQQSAFGRASGVTQRQESKRTGLGSRSYTKKSKPEPKKSAWETVQDRIRNLFSSSGGTTNPKTKPEPKKGNIYSKPEFTVPDTSNFMSPTERRRQDLINNNQAGYYGRPDRVDFPTFVPPNTRDDFVKGSYSAPRGLLNPPEAKKFEAGGTSDSINRAVAQANANNYTVKKGDTLTKIARDNNTTVKAIADLNNIDDVDLILTDQTIQIPTSTTVPQPVTELRVSSRGDEDPDAQFYQSGVPMDQRIYEPEDTTGFAGMGPDPSTGQPIIRGLMSKADDDMGLPYTRSDTEKQIAFEPMFKFIQKGEGDYNSSNRGTIGKSIKGATNNTTRDGKKLTEMTIGEIKAKQTITDPNNPERLFAVGRFQTIPTTLDMAIDALGLSDDTVFNENTQDRIGMYLVTQKRPEVGKYLEGDNSVSQDEAMLQLAKEFASFPVPYDMTIERGGKTVELKKGDSYYGSGNKAQHTFEEVEDELDKLRGNI